jgi:serine protease AprX
MKHSRKALFLAAAASVFAFALQTDDRTTGISFDDTNPVLAQQSFVKEANQKAATARESSAMQNVDAISPGSLPLAIADTWVATTNAALVDNNLRVTDLTGPAQQDTQDSDQAATPAVTARAKMSGPVAALVAAGASGEVDLIVRYDDHPELFDDERVAELGGTVLRSYEVLNMRAIRISAATLVELAIEDNVDWLSIDDNVMSTSVSSRIVANVPGTSTANEPFNGTGVGVAILDTGVAQHQDLQNDFRQYSFLNGAYPTPSLNADGIALYNDDPRIDLFGHGTHVAGIVTGSGADSGAQFKGTATDAHFLSLQVLGQYGGGSLSDVMAALDWLLVYGHHFNIRVVNLSLGMAVTESNTTDPLVMAVEELWDAGFVVVIAAGNYGFHGNQTVTSPANSRKVITVGSVTDNGTGADHSDDYVSSFSSMGPTFGDNVLKPDLIAPGNRIVATITAESVLATDLPDRVISCTSSDCDTVYLEMSGTSMATPMVTAAVARMLQKDSSLTPATVKARLMRSARKIDTNFVAAGAGLLDVDAAMNDTGIIAGDALSPLMFDDAATNGIIIEDTAVLWGDSAWSSGYLYTGGFGWSSDFSWTDVDGVTSSGFTWTDGSDINATGFGWTNGNGLSASGFGWTNRSVSAKGFGWTNRSSAQSLLADDANGKTLNDDVPSD